MRMINRLVLKMLQYVVNKKNKKKVTLNLNNLLMVVVVVVVGLLDPNKAGVLRLLAQVLQPPQLLPKLLALLPPWHLLLKDLPPLLVIVLHLVSREAVMVVNQHHQVVDMGVLLNNNKPILQHQ
eukprot:Lithocolla_globosa_v1_NODE_1135_length_2844_cov_18.474364.p4 type:complete len:124 gc:universal NODE_1135_length_2844_cov_18.474364:2173-2544(+)